MRLHISVDRLDAAELRGATQADFLIAVDGTLRIASDDAILFEEPSFPAVELAWLLSAWRAAPGARFRFDSMSLEEVDAVEITSSPSGWLVTSCYRPGSAIGPFDWAEVDAGIHSFVADIERELRALGLDPAEVLRPPYSSRSVRAQGLRTRVEHGF
ncbi:hypothetical protein [Agromyces sp. NPDC060279]|uniref:DUF7878 domain-containing protein n=1 Tax=Agromyces sp. NPDC060279 TaxID=3347092 RepID=UPI0036547153